MNSAKPAARSVLGRVKASYPRIQNILVPLDFSGNSRRALSHAIPLAQKFSAKIHLVHVLPADPRAKEEAREKLEQTTRERLNRMGTQLLPPRLRAENLVLVGHPARQILAAAAKVDADLIVLRTKGDSSLRRRLLGGTAEYVMRHSLCPVMSIRHV